MIEKLTSLLGMLVILAIAWGCSFNRRAIPWRMVVWGLSLQLALAVLILKTPFGQVLFQTAQEGVLRLNGFAMEGARMVFGPLAESGLLQEQFGQGNASILAITISATIILVSALSSLL
jgi:CNT family concentrative nucleoside transporter